MAFLYHVSEDENLINAAFVGYESLRLALNARKSLILQGS